MLALLYKAQIYFGNYFQKPKYQFGKILQILKAQVLPLVIFFQKPKHQFGKTLQILKSPSTILGNILSKAQMLVWQSSIIGNILSKHKYQFGNNFTNTQKSKYYPWQYFGKILQSPSTTFGNILEKSYKTQMLICHLF